MSLPDPILLYSMHSVETLGADLSGNGYDAIVTNVSTVSDSTYGNVADFSGTGGIELSSPPIALGTTSVNRSISMWVNLDQNGTNQVIYTQGSSTGSVNDFRIAIGRNSTELRFEWEDGGQDTFTPTLENNTWYHIVVSHDSPVHTYYFNGSFIGSKSGATADSTLIGLGKTYLSAGFNFNGQMRDFRMYDTALSASQVSTLYSVGPQVGALPLIITPTVFPYAIALDWSEIDGASTYTIKIRVDSGEYETIADGLTSLTFVKIDIGAGLTYDFELYTDLDIVTPAITVENIVTPAIDSTGANDMLTLLSNDLSQLSSSRVSDIIPFLDENLSTNDELTARIVYNNTVIPATTMTYVGQGGSINLVDKNQEPLVTPFQSDNGASQFVTVESDGTSYDVTYNETTGTISIGGAEYSVGDRFILGGKLVKIAELN